MSVIASRKEISELVFNFVNSSHGMFPVKFPIVPKMLVYSFSARELGGKRLRYSPSLANQSKPRKLIVRGPCS